MPLKGFASTADLGLVLVDARQGLTEQSRRHAVILSLLRVPHLVLAVNKMDLVDYDEAVFDKIQAEFTSFATKLMTRFSTPTRRSGGPLRGAFWCIRAHKAWWARRQKREWPFAK